MIVSKSGDRARYRQGKIVFALAHTVTVRIFSSLDLVRQSRKLIEHLLVIRHPRSRGRAAAANTLLVAVRRLPELVVHVGHRVVVATLLFLHAVVHLSKIRCAEKGEMRLTATFLKTLSQAELVPSYDLLTSLAYLVSAAAALSITAAALASPFNKGSRSCSALLLLADVSAKAEERPLVALDSFLPDLAKASVVCRCSWRAVRTLSKARSDLCSAEEGRTAAGKEEEE